MALSKITYTDKETLNPLPSVADKNKVTDDDMNEIKLVVNSAIDQVEANTIPQQATAPVSPSENDLWIDTDETGLTQVDSVVSTSSTNPIENQAITNYVNTMNEYSTTEIDTGKKWTNDKPIYRKVVETTTGSGTGTWTKIVDLPLDTLVSMHGWWITGNDKYPIDRFYNNEGITTYWNLSGIYEIHNYAYANSKSAVLIIEYTKTTD